MGKITPLGRLIVVVLLTGAIFAGLKFSGILDEKEETSKVKVVKGQDSARNVKFTSFDTNRVKPTGGVMKGIVELGAAGFNSFIVTIDANKNWKLEKAKFGESVIKEEMASEDDIRIGLKKYISGMLDYGVLGKNIHFVVSSGALKAEITGKIIKALKTMKYSVNTVTPEQEGMYALKCVLPKENYTNAFVTDIGSGNTKISWMEASKVSALETHGSKYFQTEGLTDQVVYSEVMTKAKTIPASRTRTCFIIGGVPFKMAKQIRKDKERYTTLLKPSEYKMEDKKDQSGVNIYKGIADATGCEKFIFDWDANFSIGFLLELPY